ncbi:hypothetical protein AAZX31_02G203700 [Glycine max]|uniref:Uncharacterized protein n=2 Tax=Glycine subgen. Soja TaxID=1462606 RepID=K7KA11_SOYBN|nr:hypothetical protein JHK87_004864 [Glycine soja]KAG5064018.1 hypothetical protein JHK85_005201 [Glycine max]KAG5080971.1 hypothetical protein JHK86_005036 [Glycine max]KAH1061512.1 hypothetical protein GYH30_004813 [Glycine max]KHN26171.1 hypothetical protein glysoja_019495 [Glycine soja]
MPPHIFTLASSESRGFYFLGLSHRFRTSICSHKAKLRKQTLYAHIIMWLDRSIVDLAKEQNKIKRT